MRGAPISDPRLILASSSPRRRDLLAPYFPRLEIRAAHIDEEAWQADDPAALTLALSQAKAEAVAGPRTGENGWVLGADTVVAIDGEILGKPQSAQDARSMLDRLRGRVHDVFTGVTVIPLRGRSAVSGAVRSRVWFRGFRDRELQSYVESGEPMDKAGAYAIQGGGGRLVERIEGCYNNIVGLPLCEVFRLLGQVAEALEDTEPVCFFPDGTPCPRTNSPEFTSAD